MITVLQHIPTYVDAPQARAVVDSPEHVLELSFVKVWTTVPGYKRFVQCKSGSRQYPWLLVAEVGDNYFTVVACSETLELPEWEP